jgi:hypothetical protein
MVSSTPLSESLSHRPCRRHATGEPSSGRNTSPPSLVSRAKPSSLRATSCPASTTRTTPPRSLPKSGALTLLPPIKSPKRQPPSLRPSTLIRRPLWSAVTELEATKNRAAIAWSSVMAAASDRATIGAASFMLCREETTGTSRLPAAPRITSGRRPLPIARRYACPPALPPFRLCRNEVLIEYFGELLDERPGAEVTAATSAGANAQLDSQIAPQYLRNWPDQDQFGEIAP